MYLKVSPINELSAVSLLNTRDVAIHCWTVMSKYLVEALLGNLEAETSSLETQTVSSVME